MKLVGLLLTLVLTTVTAGVPRPEITVGLNVGAGETGSLGGIEPKVKWSTSGEVAGVDVEGGMELTVKEVDEHPATNVWGKLRKSFAGLGDISVRGDMDANTHDSVDLDVRANGFGTSVQVLGKASAKSVSVSKVQVSRNVDVLGGTLTVVPNYHVAKRQGDVRLGYAIGPTAVQVEAQSKRLTVSHAITDKDKIIPSVTAAGDVALSYSRDLEGGRITTTWIPNDSVQLKWNDDVYETTIKAPLEGYYKANQGLKVNMKRTVDMF